MCSVCSCFWPLPLIISCILLSSGITHTSRDCHCALHTAVFHVTFSLKWKLEFWALRHRSFTTHVATVYVLFSFQVQAVKKQKFCSENRSDGRTEQCLNFVFLLYQFCPVSLVTSDCLLLLDHGLSLCMTQSPQCMCTQQCYCHIGVLLPNVCVHKMS